MNINNPQRRNDVDHHHDDDDAAVWGVKWPLLAKTKKKSAENKFHLKKDDDVAHAKQSAERNVTAESGQKARLRRYQHRHIYTIYIYLM